MHQSKLTSAQEQYTSTVTILTIKQQVSIILDINFWWFKWSLLHMSSKSNKFSKQYPICWYISSCFIFLVWSEYIPVKFESIIFETSVKLSISSSIWKKTQDYYIYMIIILDNGKTQCFNNKVSFLQMLYELFLQDIWFDISREKLRIHWIINNKQNVTNKLIS